jgi:hypothetical protein
MALSLALALRERRKTGKNTALVIFAGAFAVTVAILGYYRIRYGYFL